MNIADTLFPVEGETQRTAVISEDGLYRFALTRIWDTTLPLLAWCGLNPSTADHEIDDQTIRKETWFTRAWGFGGFVKVNASAFRSTDPKNLTAEHFDNEANLSAILHLTEGRPLILCWGASFPKAAAGKVAELARQLRGERDCYHLGLTKDGHPRHPLFLPYEGTERTAWPL